MLGLSRKKKSIIEFFVSLVVKNPCDLGSKIQSWILPKKPTQCVLMALLVSQSIVVKCIAASFSVRWIEIKSALYRLFAVSTFKSLLEKWCGEKNISAYGIVKETLTSEPSEGPLLTNLITRITIT